MQFAGEWTELLRWQCIAPAEAREAVRFFYRTGGLWPEVAWVPSGIDQLIPAEARFNASIQDEMVSVAWDNRETIASGLDALDSVLDEIAAGSDPVCPTVATVTRQEARLSIAQGADRAILSFDDVEERIPSHASLGDPQARGEVSVMLGQVRTQVPCWRCIEPAVAREAMRHFYRTGGLWPGIAWSPNALWAMLGRA